MSKESKRRSAGDGTVYYSEKLGRWIGQLSAGKNHLGKRQRITISSRSRSGLQAKMEEAQEQARSGITISSNISLSEWLQNWFDTYKRPHLRQNTIVSYKHILGRLEKHLGSRKLSSLTTSDLQDGLYAAFSAEQYRSLAYTRTLIRMALAKAVSEGLIARNPADGIELPRRPARKRFHKPDSHAWRKLYEAPTPLRCWPLLILTEYVTGLRRSELLALSWQDFTIAFDKNGQPESGHLDVKHALILGYLRPDGSRQLIMADTKTENSARRLALPISYLHVLLEYKNWQDLCKELNQSWEHPELVFTAENGSYINPSTFSSIFTRTRRKLGIETTFHGLRHDMATSMKHAKRFDMKDIQAQLGHSNIQTTLNIYTHIDEENNRIISDWLDERSGQLLETQDS